MTTPIVPWFVAELFKEEIRKIQHDIIERICKEYKLNKKDVVEKLNIPEIKFTDNTVRIIRKNPEVYGSKNKNNKCIARVYDKNERTLCQCKRSQKKECGKYCKSHYDLVQKNNLTLGTINDPVPSHIQSKLTTKIY